MTRPRPSLRLASVLFAAWAASLGGCRSSPTAALETCVPGETLIVGCAEGCGIGACTGDPVLRVCDGALGTNGCRNTTDRTMFEDTDDTACGRLCPRTRVVCPASGSIAIATRGISTAWSCDYETEHRGILPPGGRSPGTEACAPGAPIEIGCALGCGIGECVGSATIRTCDGTASIEACMSGSAPAIRETSGSSGCGVGCPQYVVQCPPSGSLTVVPRSSGGSGSEYLCDWLARPVAHRAGATEVCSPGSRLVVGCAAACSLGACRGNGALRVCDGNTTPEACLAIPTASLTLGEETRSACDGECPQLQVSCPPSGAITVVSRALDSDEGFGCDWAVRAAGIGE